MFGKGIMGVWIRITVWRIITWAAAARSASSWTMAIRFALGHRYNAWREKVMHGASARTMGSWYCGEWQEDYLDTCDPLCLALNNGVTYGDSIIRVRTWYNENWIIQEGMTGKCIASIHTQIHVCRVGVIVIVWDMDMVRVRVELTG